MLANKLEKGDTIGVLAPVKALKNYDKIYLEKATTFFENLGLKIKYGKYLFSEENYCAGTPQERAQDINDMFSNTEVKAIFTVKGGDMLNGVLPYIDWNNIKNNPKMFLGMSDITVLLCAIHQMTGLITYHCNDYLYYGMKELTEYDKNEITDKLFQGNGVIIPFDERIFINVKAKITGKLWGTNIISLLKLIGTPWMPNLDNAILFLEDYYSNITQWNTMIEQLNHSDNIGNAIVYGYLYQIQCVENNKYKIEDESLKIKPNIPIIKTNDFGHKHPNAIIPIGVNIDINPDDKSITIVDDYLN